MQFPPQPSQHTTEAYKAHPRSEYPKQQNPFDYRLELLASPPSLLDTQPGYGSSYTQALVAWTGCFAVATAPSSCHRAGFLSRIRSRQAVLSSLPLPRRCHLLSRDDGCRRPLWHKSCRVPREQRHLFDYLFHADINLLVGG